MLITKNRIMKCRSPFLHSVYSESATYQRTQPDIPTCVQSSSESQHPHLHEPGGVDEVLSLLRSHQQGRMRVVFSYEAKLHEQQRIGRLVSIACADLLVGTDIFRRICINLSAVGVCCQKSLHAVHAFKGSIKFFILGHVALQRMII